MAKMWYALRVQAGRENKIKENLRKRILSQGVDELFGEMIIPTEKVVQIKGSKRQERERRLFPGYLYLEIETGEFDESENRYQMDTDAYFAVKETPGVGDFVGDRNKPIPMSTADVSRILQKEEDMSSKSDEPVISIDLDKGDQVKVKDGPFENFEGVVDEVFPARGMVRVVVTIFGRATPVDLEYWQVGSVS